MFSTTARYSRARSFARADGLGVVDRLGLHPQGLARAGHAGADDGPREPADHQGFDAGAGLAQLLDLGDGAHPGVPGVGLRHQEQGAVVGRRGGVGGGASLVGLDREGDDHAGQHDPGRQRQQGQQVCVDIRHLAPSFSGSGSGRSTTSERSIERRLFPVGNGDYNARNPGIQAR